MATVAEVAARVAARLEFTADLAQVLFDHSPDATIIVGEAGDIAAANRQAALLTMYPTSELIGMLVDELLPTTVRDNHPDHRAGFFADPRVRPMGIGLDLRLRRRNGDEVPVDINLSPVMLVQGAYVIATIRRRQK